MKKFKLCALSTECCLEFIGQRIDAISHFSSLLHHLRPSKWRVRWSVGRIFAKLRHSSEPHFEALSKVCINLIKAQPTRELHSGCWSSVGCRQPQSCLTHDRDSTPLLTWRKRPGANSRPGRGPSRRTPGLRPPTLEPGVAIDLHRDGPGPPRMVSDREGCRGRIGGRPVPTRMIAASVNSKLKWQPVTLSY